MSKRGEATPRTANRPSSYDDVVSGTPPLEETTIDADVAANDRVNGTATVEAARINPNEGVSQVLFDAEETTQNSGHPKQHSPLEEATSLSEEQLPKVRALNDDTPSIHSPDSATKTARSKNHKGKSSKKRKKKTTRSTDKAEMLTRNSKPLLSRKRGRSVRVVALGPKENAATKVDHSLLPGNQYTTTLHRRAIRKLPDGDVHQQHHDKEKYAADDYGDISLGMKLIVVGGKVIVQHLNALNDGLASPAQLAGIIQRGDVLLAIGCISLVNLPVDQLMEGLRPLSTPGPNGVYERVLILRFDAGAGLELLKIHEEGQKATTTRQEPADAMFSLFPMVDQLSGAPLFEDHMETYERKEEADHDKVEESTEDALKEHVQEDDSMLTDKKSEKVVKDLDDLITSTLAKERTIDREWFQSEYFDWREDLSDLLRRTVSLVKKGDGDGRRLTKAERLALGKRILQMTKILENNMEEIDKGRDLRSFKTWSTNFSLRSGVSARRRYVMDPTSVRSSRVTDDDSLGGNESIASEQSGGSLGGVDADTLLLGLAARDEIWRKQVLVALETAIQEAENFEREGGEEENQASDNEPTGINEALTQQLGNFLFGDMTKIVKHEKRSFALPPDEITRVLFDLTTNLATKTPDEITVFGGSSRISSNVSSLFSATTRTDGQNKAAIRADLLLANRFVLDEALPKWLRSFRPLPLDQRRVMWPRSYRRPDTTMSTFTGQMSEFTGRSSEADALTLDSGGAETNDSSPSRKKGIRELVEDQQIDSETRSETCFLVTYFFTHKIVGADTHGDAKDKLHFVERFGAYLQMHTCLSFAASVKDNEAITQLMKIAKFDPSHVDTVTEIKRSKNLVLYDSVKLSAVLEMLHNLRNDTKQERRKLVCELCVSAYPDILPWQVRQACLGPKSGQALPEAQMSCSEEELEDHYYCYLSQLLHPFDGNDRARHDEELLEEYCEWSVGVLPRPSKKADRLENFLNIASPSSFQHNRYKRDLMVLLRLGVVTGKEDLVLDLVDEILENRKLLLNKNALHKVLGQLRKLGSDALVSVSATSKESTGFRILGRVLKLFEKMATCDSIICRDSLVVSDELYHLFQNWKIQSGSSGDDPKMYLLIDFVIDESSSPADVFRSLVLWSSSNDCGNLLFPRLRALLRRGVHFAALKGELSGTLLRLRHARGTFKELNLTSPGERHIKKGTGIWEAMATADLSIDK